MSTLHKYIYNKKTIIVVFILVFLFVTNGFLSTLYGEHDGVLTYTETNEFALDKDLIFSNTKHSLYKSTSGALIKNATNSLGYRGNEFTQKKRGVYRILTVGDSVTFGHGIDQNDETYPKMLEKYLAAKGKTVEVLNVGVRGYSPDQEYRQIILRLLSLNPDMIIWNLNSPGDLHDMVKQDWPTPSLYDIKSSQLIPKDARFNWVYMGKYVKEHLPQFIRNSPPVNFCIHIASKTYLLTGQPLLQKKELTSWALKKLELQLYDVKKITSEHKIDFVVGVLPYSPEFIMPQEDAGVASAFNAFFTSLDDKKIDVVDVKKIILNKKIVLKSLYFTTDSHPNQLGARVFAEVMGDSILDKVR